MSFTSLAIYAALHVYHPPVVGTMRDNLVFQPVPRGTYNGWNLVGMMREPIPLNGDACDDVRRECNAILASLPSVVGNVDFDGNGTIDSNDFYTFVAAYLQIANQGTP